MKKSLDITKRRYSTHIVLLHRITGYFCFKTDSTQQLTHKSVKVRIQRLKSIHNKSVNETGYAIKARCETEKGFLFGLFLLSIYFIFISRSAAIGSLNTNKFGSTKHIFKQLSLSTLK